MSHLLQIGWDARRVLGVGSLLIHIVHAMGLTSLRMVDVTEIDQAGERWTNNYRGGMRAHGRASPLLFVTRARQWLRFHGFLILPGAPTGRFDTHLAQFKSALELRGLASCTVRLYVDRSHVFLEWLSERHSDISNVSVNDVDDFLDSKREAGWRLRTLAGQCTALRSFFTYAEYRGWCLPSVWHGIVIPRSPKYTEAPTGPTWAQVRQVIRSVRGKTPEALRGRAILLLLSVYGLRASEVTRLRLDDFDWRNETFRVQRSKRGGIQQFPVQYEVGEALLNYLRNGRAHCACRHIFLTLKLPYRPLNPVTVGFIARKRLKQMEVQSERQGPHSLRHACATQLLKKGSSLKKLRTFLDINLPNVCPFTRSMTGDLCVMSQPSA
ncbi:tyrosine-type recombinase/integrase [Granulicella sp. L46]|uniref:tyrosine-type recombinase/integrase n=1 Tax=Granulicella sp. L46 TaxID=1641865 RepID=UPI00131DB7D2